MKSKQRQRMMKNDIRTRLANDAFGRIAQDKYLRSRMVFQGGSTMRRFYGSLRATPDIDFVWTVKTDLKKEKGRIIAHLNGLYKEGFEGKPVRFIQKTDSNTFLRVAYQLEISPGFSPTLTLEGAWSPPVLGTMRMKMGKGYLNVEQPVEIVLDKLFANYERLKSRQSVKLSDIYDVFALTNYYNSALSFEQMEKKAAGYSKNISPKSWKEHLNTLEILLKGKGAELTALLGKQIDPAIASVMPAERMIQRYIEVARSLVGETEKQ